MLHYDFSAHSYNLAEFEAAVDDGNLKDKIWIDNTTGAISFDLASDARTGKTKVEWDSVLKLRMDH